MFSGASKPKASENLTSRAGRTECYTVGRWPAASGQRCCVCSSVQRPARRRRRGRCARSGGPTPPHGAPGAAPQARDAFYQCVRECGLLYNSGTPVPAKCKDLRKRFERACLPSWVKHFDEQQEQEARAAKRLHTAIQQKAGSAAGNLAGAAQR